MNKVKNIAIYALLAVLAVGSLAPSASAKTWQQRNQQLREKYQTARQQYLKEVSWWRTARQQFVAARLKYKKFRNAENQAAYEEQAKNFLDKTITVLIKRLTVLKDWISNRENLPAEDREAILSEIDEDISWLQAKQALISSATPEELKAYAAEVRDYWRRHRWQMKKIIGHIWSARLDWIIGRFEEAVTKAENKINELKAQGYNTAQLEDWLADLKEKINLAKEKQQAAEQQYQSISNLSEANSLFNSSRQFINQAHQYLREAHRQLIQIIKEMKQLVSTSSAAAE